MSDGEALRRAALRFVGREARNLHLPRINLVNAGKTLEVTFSLPVNQGWLDKWDPGDPSTRKCPTCQAGPNEPCSDPEHPLSMDCFGGAFECHAARRGIE